MLTVLLLLQGLRVSLLFCCVCASCMLVPNCPLHVGTQDFTQQSDALI